MSRLLVKGVGIVVGEGAGSVVGEDTMLDSHVGALRHQLEVS